MTDTDLAALEAVARWMHADCRRRDAELLLRLVEAYREQRGMNLALAERVADLSEMLSRRAERTAA